MVVDFDYCWISNKHINFFDRIIRMEIRLHFYKYILLYNLFSCFNVSENYLIGA